MVKLVNTFRGQDPTAATLARLGTALFGDRVSGALKREKLRKAELENIETRTFQDLIAKGGVNALAADPMAQAVFFGSGRDPREFAALNRLDAATRFGAADQRTQNSQVAAGSSFNATADAHATNQQRMRDATAAAIASREAIAEAERQRKTREFQDTPVEALDKGVPVFVPQGSVTRADEFGNRVAPVLTESEVKGNTLRDVLPGLSDLQKRAVVGAAPTRAQAQGDLITNNFDNLGELDPAQQAALGAQPRSPSGSLKNYRAPDGKVFLTRDGSTDVQTGQPLPPGGFLANAEGSAEDVGLTNSVQTDLQSDLIANKKFNSLLNQALPLTESPELFGIQGAVRSKAQEILQLAEGGASLVNAQNELAQTIGSQNAQTVLPELYDPRLSEVETLWGLIVYQGAAALAGQENRSVSDKDVQFMKQILGDPRSLFSSNRSMKTKLETARRVVNGFDRISREALGKQEAAPGAPTAPRGSRDNPIPWQEYTQQGGQ